MENKDLINIIESINKSNVYLSANPTLHAGTLVLQEHQDAAKNRTDQRKSGTVPIDS